MLREAFENIVAAVARASGAHYRGRLISLAVFGSVARGTMRPDSDVDLLIVAKGLPRGRMARVRDFDAIETAVSGVLQEAQEKGVRTALSPVIKTPEEVKYGSPLFLDMTREVRILYDEGRFLRDYLQDLDQRLKAMGARRIRRGGGYYWLLKPNYKPGEQIRL